MMCDEVRTTSIPRHCISWTIETGEHISKRDRYWRETYWRTGIGWVIVTFAIRSSPHRCYIFSARSAGTTEPFSEDQHDRFRNGEVISHTFGYWIGKFVFVGNKRASKFDRFWGTREWSTRLVHAKRKSHLNANINYTLRNFDESYYSRYFDYIFRLTWDLVHPFSLLFGELLNFTIHVKPSSKIQELT